MKLSASAPDGFTVYSHAGDDFAACRDHVRALLGLAPWIAERRDRGAPIARQGPAQPREGGPPPRDEQPPPLPFGPSSAGKLWAKASTARNALRALSGRHAPPRARRRPGAQRHQVASPHQRHAFAVSQHPRGRRQAVLRTYINPDADARRAPLHRPIKNAAVMLDPFDAVLRRPSRRRRRRNVHDGATIREGAADMGARKGGGVRAFPFSAASSV